MLKFHYKRTNHFRFVTPSHATSYNYIRNFTFAYQPFKREELKVIIRNLKNNKTI